MWATPPRAWWRRWAAAKNECRGLGAACLTLWGTGWPLCSEAAPCLAHSVATCPTTRALACAGEGAARRRLCSLCVAVRMTTSPGTPCWPSALRSTRGTAACCLAQMRETGYFWRQGDVSVKLAEAYGFCWGVERAVQMAYEARRAYPGQRLHITNEIIHNPGGCGVCVCLCVCGWGPGGGGDGGGGAAVGKPCAAA